MQLQTTRFGNIDVDENRIIRFPAGLPGFTEARRFILLEHAPNNPFHWLQNVDDPSLAFVVIDPLLVEPGYGAFIPRAELESLQLKGAKEAVILSLVTIDRADREVTTNLLAPLVVNPVTRQGKQLILVDTNFSTKHGLVNTAQRQQANP
jgi:flagellar assembly factor FliW